MLRSGLSGAGPCVMSPPVMAMSVLSEAWAGWARPVSDGRLARSAKTSLAARTRPPRGCLPPSARVR